MKIAFLHYQLESQMLQKALKALKIIRGQAAIYTVILHHGDLQGHTSLLSFIN